MNSSFPTHINNTGTFSVNKMESIYSENPDNIDTNDSYYGQTGTQIDNFDCTHNEDENDIVESEVENTGKSHKPPHISPQGSLGNNQNQNQNQNQDSIIINNFDVENTTTTTSNKADTLKVRRNRGLGPSPTNSDPNPSGDVLGLHIDDHCSNSYSDSITNDNKESASDAANFSGNAAMQGRPHNNAQDRPTQG